MEEVIKGTDASNGARAISLGREKFKQVVQAIRKLEEEELFSRQPDPSDLLDPFETIYDRHFLLEPSFPFDKLHKVFNESDILQACVDVYMQNIDGFGYQLLFLGEDLTGRSSLEASQQKVKLESFFNHANEHQSWTTIRKLMRMDLESIGNGAFEMVRSNDKRIQLAYHLPFRTVRMTRLDTEPVSIKVIIARDGVPTEIRIKKFFRKYCMIRESTQRKLRWFKELGDPRMMDSETGEFVTKKPKISATEILHLKLPYAGEVYGVPRWLSCVLDVQGRRSAQYVNWDLFESQGIAPMAVLVSGGVLTDESWEDLEMLVRSSRGTENWNKIMVLEANPETTGLEEKGSAKLDLKNLTEFRKEDQMFEKYLDGTKKNVRQRFRLPALYLGGTEDINFASSVSTRTITEEQVFVPMREEFDEIINQRILLQEMKGTLWKYQTKGPKILGTEEVTRGVRAFQAAGALTINHAVDLANQAFGLEMSKFTEKWADYPILLVLEMIRNGGKTKLKGLEEFIQASPPLTAAQSFVPKPNDVE